MKRLLKWVPLIALILSGFGVVYNQGIRIEHRLTCLETKVDMLTSRPEAKRGGYQRPCLPRRTQMRASCALKFHVKGGFTMKVGEMVNYKVNDKPENNFPARVTWVNTNEAGSPDGTLDLLVMVHPEDFPEFSKDECERGHAHRLGVKGGTGPGTYQTIPAPAASSDPRVDSLASQVSSLATNVSALTAQVAKLSQPAAPSA